MVYTQARLDEALQVFRESEPYRVTRDLKSDNLERHLRSKYDFRRTQVVVAPKLWRLSDAEDSSDEEYDPDKRKKKRVLDLPAKIKKQKKKAAGDEEKEANDKAGTSTSEQDTIAFLIFSLRSEKGRKLLQQMVEEHGREPHKASSQEEEPSQWAQGGGSFNNVDRHWRTTEAMMEICNAQDDSCDAMRESGRALRSRQVSATMSKGRKGGCRQCREAKELCSLEPKQEGPCARCDENGMKCIVVKKRKTNAEQQEAETSHSGGRGSSEAITQDSVTTSGPASQILSSKPIANATMSSTQVPRGATPATAIDLEKSDSPPGSPQRHPPEARKPAAAEAAEVTRIRTFWAHPVKFQHVPTADLPCHFCDDYRYGLQGHGVRPNVEVMPSTLWQNIVLTWTQVIAYPDRFIEMGGGHRELGLPSTRMCINCALDRLHISRCRHTGLEDIPGLDESKVFTAEYINHIIDDKPDRERKPKTAVCAICPAPANSKCCTAQRFDRFGRRLTGATSIRGCGLVLCGQCRGIVEGQIWDMQRIDTAPRQISLPLRPDREFLFAGSLLHKAYAK